MSAQTSQTVDEVLGWLRQVPGDLFKLDQKPLLGSPPQFPWEKFAKQLADTFHLTDLSVKPGEILWRSKENLFEGLGGNVRCLSLGLTPLNGTVWWGMPEEEILALVDLLLTKKTISPEEQIDPNFLGIFYRFLGVETIRAFKETHPDKNLAVSLASGEDAPKDACLTIDLSIKFGERQLYGRLFLSQEFRQSWSQHYLESDRLNSPIARTLETIVHLQVGRVKLRSSEWQTIAPGDFLVLDKCTLDPNEDKGRVLLVINDLPFFRAKIKQGTLKILEHPLHYEVDTVMDQTPKNKNEDENSEFDEEFDMSDEHTDEHTDEHDAETSEFDVDESEVEGEELTDEHSEASEEFEEEASEVEEGSEEENHNETVTEEETKEAEVLHGHVDSPEEIRSLDDIPLPIVVEIGRLQMSIKELLELQPGNMLELDTKMDANVDLVVHGKRIGRGELLRVGTVLGVRITEVS